MSFSDRPDGPNARLVGFFALLLILAFANLFLLMGWLISFYDLDLDGPRPFDLSDLIMPASLIVSAAILYLYHRFVLRDKD